MCDRFYPLDHGVAGSGKCSDRPLHQAEEELTATLGPDFRSETFPGNCVTSSDAFIHAGLNAIQTLRRSTPNGRETRSALSGSFNASLKIDFQESRVTSDGVLIVVRELDERWGLGDLPAQHLTDSRRGKNAQLPLADLLRQSVYSRMAGYGDVNDAARLSQDPAFRRID